MLCRRSLLVISVTYNSMYTSIPTSQLIPPQESVLTSSPHPHCCSYADGLGTTLGNRLSSLAGPLPESISGLPFSSELSPQSWVCDVAPFQPESLSLCPGSRPGAFAHASLSPRGICTCHPPACRLSSLSWLVPTGAGLRIVASSGSITLNKVFILFWVCFSTRTMRI